MDMHLTKAKNYRAHGCEEKNRTLIDHCAERKEIFSKLPASAMPQPLCLMLKSILLLGLIDKFLQLAS